MSIRRSSIVLLFATTVFGFATMAPAIDQTPDPQLDPYLLQSPVTFDNIINPLQQFGINSDTALAITYQHQLARQEVALAIGYLVQHKDSIQQGNDALYNKVFGGFYDRSNPNFLVGYKLDQSNYLHVLHTFQQIQTRMSQPTFYGSWFNQGPVPNVVAHSGPLIGFDDRGLRQWGNSNSDSLKNYNAYFPLVSGTGTSATYYTAGVQSGQNTTAGSTTGSFGPGITVRGEPNAIGGGLPVRWDQDTDIRKPSNPANLYALPLGIYPTNPPDSRTYSNGTPLLSYSVTNTTAGGVVLQNIVAQAFENPLKTYASTVNDAFYNQKLDLFGFPNDPNHTYLGGVFLNNTEANRLANAPIERITNLVTDPLTVLPWNSGSEIAGRDPKDFGVPLLRQFEMMIANFSEFTVNPQDPTGGAFWGLSSLISQQGGSGAAQLVAGVFDASNYGLFVEGLNNMGVTDLRQFPPIGKTGQFEPGVPSPNQVLAAGIAAGTIVAQVNSQGIVVFIPGVP